jgi:hypothetical protein
MSQSPSSTLEPFTQSDYLKSFFNGAVWGGFALAILGVLAWVVGVARFRTYTGALVNQRTLSGPHQNETEIHYEHPSPHHQ